MTGARRIEYRFDKDQLRGFLEAAWVTESVEGMEFRIEPITGGTQRDPVLKGITAIWWQREPRDTQ